jgi:hypothetical protein
MKTCFFFLSLAALLTLGGCNKDKIKLEIVSPADGATFSKSQSIDVKVTATTQKGHILQVQLTVDTILSQYRTAEPYHFTIPPKTFLAAKMYPLSVMAYSSKGVQEGAAIFIKITE